MKIIKRGTPLAEREYRTTCRSCRTVFEFVRNEAKYTPCQRDGDYLDVKCPVCEQHCYVDVTAFKKPVEVDPY